MGAGRVYKRFADFPHGSNRSPVAEPVQRTSGRHKERPVMSTTAPAPAKPIRRIAKTKSAGRTTLAKVGHTDARWFVVDAARKLLVASPLRWRCG